MRRLVRRVLLLLGPGATAVAAACYPVRERVHPTVSGRLTSADGRPVAGAPLALSTRWGDTTCSAITERTHTAPDGSFEFPAPYRWSAEVMGLIAEGMFEWRVCAPAAGGVEERLVPVYSATAFGGTSAPASDRIACTLVVVPHSATPPPPQVSAASADSAAIFAAGVRCERIAYRRSAD